MFRHVILVHAMDGKYNGIVVFLIRNINKVENLLNLYFKQILQFNQNKGIKA